MVESGPKPQLNHPVVVCKCTFIHNQALSRSYLQGIPKLYAPIGEGFQRNSTQDSRNDHIIKIIDTSEYCSEKTYLVQNSFL